MHTLLTKPMSYRHIADSRKQLRVSTDKCILFTGPCGTQTLQQGSQCLVKHISCQTSLTSISERQFYPCPYLLPHPSFSIVSPFGNFLHKVYHHLKVHYVFILARYLFDYCLPLQAKGSETLGCPWCAHSPWKHTWHIPSTSYLSVKKRSKREWERRKQW